MIEVLHSHNHVIVGFKYLSNLQAAVLVKLMHLTLFSIILPIVHKQLPQHNLQVTSRNVPREEVELVLSDEF